MNRDLAGAVVAAQGRLEAFWLPDGLAPDPVGERRADPKMASCAWMAKTSPRSGIAPPPV